LEIEIEGRRDRMLGFGLVVGVLMVRRLPGAPSLPTAPVFEDWGAWPDGKPAAYQGTLGFNFHF